MYKNTFIYMVMLAAVSLSGCGDNEGESNKGSQNTYAGAFADEQARLANSTYAVFNPALSQLPVPIDILFAQELAEDGTFAGDDSNPISLALDFADGGSTSSAIDIKFNGFLDPDSVDGNSFVTANNAPAPNPTQNVFLLELTYPGGDAVLQADGGEVPTFALGIELATLSAIGAQLSSVAEALQQDPTNATLQAQLAGLQSAFADQSAAVNDTVVKSRAEVVNLDGGNTVLRINPLEPLKPATKYIVFVTEELRNQAGEPVSESSAFNNLAGDDPLPASSLVPVRTAVQGWLQLAEGWLNAATNQSRAAIGLGALSRDDIAIAYTFTTGGTNAVLSSIADPESYFANSFASRDKKAAITSLTDGTLSLDATSIPGLIADTALSANEKCLNIALLTAATTANTSFYVAAIDPSSDEYDPTITRFADVTGSTDQYILQATTANIGNQLGNEELTNVAGIECSDDDGVSHAVEAVGTVAALSSSGFEFPTPIARDAAFYASLPVAAVSPVLTNEASLYLGRISLPYYLKVPTEADPSNLASTWEANQSAGLAPSDKITYRFPFPARQDIVDVPLLVQAPAACEAPGCPVVIYQHGIFGNRSHSLGLGNQLAGPGFATVAIDLPLHGVAPATVTDILDPALALSVDVDANNDFAAPAFKALPAFANLQERHFGWSNPTGTQPERMVYALDVAATTGASGQNYINLSVLAASRDSNRQAVVDLFNLGASLGNISAAIQASGGPVLDTSRVYFVGHSLGGIIGTPFVAVNNDTRQSGGNNDLALIAAAALVNPGGQITKLLENSPSIGGNIIAGLAASGLPQGSSNLETYFTAAQGLFDTADPINFGALLASNTPVYVNEIYGDGSNTDTRDQTIPIAADELYAGSYSAPLGMALSAPLAGTEPLIAQLQSELVTGDNPALSGTGAVVRFTAGTHSSIILPDSVAATTVFADMATNIISFFSSNGTAISFNNANFVKQEAPQP